MNISYYIKHPKEFLKKVFLKLFILKVKKSSKFENKDNFSVRNYKNYNTYIEHQKAKFFVFQESVEKGFEKRTIKFKNNFSKIDNFSQKNILCLGSRSGAEVKAFRELGALGVGIDLVYPKNNQYVHYGDFHNIPYPDNVFDYVFTNVLDHMYDPKLLFSEVKATFTDNTSGICSTFFFNSLAISEYFSESVPLMFIEMFTLPFLTVAKILLFFCSKLNFVIGSLNFLEKV